jgi:glycosyl transferase, family 25
MNLTANTTHFLQHYFDRVFVITLPRLTHRHKTVSEKLNGLHFHFFFGTDKLEIDIEKLRVDNVYNEAKAIKLQRQGKPLTAGEVACSLSHRSVYFEMIKNNWQRVLILEDDIVPVENILHLLPTAINELPKNWDLVYFGYLKNETVTFKSRVKQFFYKLITQVGLFKWNYTMVSNMLPKPFSSYLRKAGFHDCTHAYALTLDGAQKLFAAQTPVVYRADDALSHTILKGELNAFIAEPKFFEQEGFNNPHVASEIN